MDPAAFRVVYVDRRVSQERDLDRDDPLPTTPSIGQTGYSAGDSQLYVENEEIIANIRAILSVFYSVSICTSGPSCVSKLGDIVKHPPTPTLLILDIPKTEPNKEDRDVECQHDSAIVTGPSDPMYGLSLLRFVCLEIEKGRISDLVIPIASVSNSREALAGLGASGRPNDPSWCEGDDDGTSLSARCVDCGAVDVLTGQFSQERVKGLSIHCYRAAKKHSRQVIRARKLSWVGVPEVQKCKNSDYTYLREKMVSELMTDIVKPKKLSTTPSGFQVQVSPAREDIIKRMVGRWHFSAHEFTDMELLLCAHTMFEHAFTMPEIEGYRIPTGRLTDFLVTSRAAYNETIPYHNFRHVVDVLQAIFVLLVQLGILPPYPGTIISPESLNNSGLASLIRPVDALALMISAVGHDVGHPGVNNAFLVRMKAPLAQVYNDKSVLESFHCAAFSQVLRRHWPESQEAEMRKLMIDTILATDMGLHFEYMGKFEGLKLQFREAGGVEHWDDKTVSANRTLLCSMLIKCADISNVARGHDCAAQWATILIEEFSRQASMEKELGIPSSLAVAPMMGNILALAQSQTGFMNLFAIPLFRSCSEVMPALQFTVEELTLNIKKWTLTIKDCEERNISAPSSPHIAGETSDEPEITLKHESGSADVSTTNPKDSKLSQASSHRSSYEWSDRSGQSSVVNRANARSSTSSPYNDSRPPSGPREDTSRRSSTTVPSDIPLEKPLSGASTEPTKYKVKMTPTLNGNKIPLPKYSNGYLRSRKKKISYGAFPRSEKQPPVPNGLLTINAAGDNADRPRSSPPDLDHNDEKAPALAVATQTVERRPSRFFKKFWGNKKKNKEES